ncbi:MAG: hypothetical protein ACT4QD_25190 [Acidobacteriota bacterium]
MKRLLIRRPVSTVGTDRAPVTILVNWRKIAGLETGIMPGTFPTRARFRPRGTD